jgi:phage-related protein
MKLIVLDNVTSFKAGMDVKVRASIKRGLSTLEYFGYAVRMPYSKNILPGIFELRITNPQNIRLIYTFMDNCIIVFHAFIKKTDKISNKEMNAIKAKFRSLQL